MRAAVKRRQALEAAELLIGTVRAVGRPVVVGLEIQVFVLQVCERPAQVDDIGALADFGKNIVEHRVFIHHRCACGQFLRVDDAGRRGQQEGDLARVIRGKLADGLYVLGKLLPGGVVHREQLCEHPVVFAQQDAALLSFLENDFVCRALGVDRCVTQGKLILHPAGKAALPAAVQQCAHAERRELCGLAVFQPELRALGPHNIDEGEPEQQHGAEHQQRIPHAAPAAVFTVHNL